MFKLLKRGNAGRYYRVVNTKTKDDVTKYVAHISDLPMTSVGSIAVPTKNPEKQRATAKLQLIINKLNRGGNHG